MSHVAMGAGGGEGGGTFRGGAVVFMLVVGIGAFVAMLVLGAYAPDLRSGRNGGPHALSNAAIGLSGIVRLAQDTGRAPRVIRNGRQLGGDDLMILTPDRASTPMGDVLATRHGKPTLVILPKWMVTADPARPGWVRYFGLLPKDEAEGVLAPQYRLAISRRRSGGRALQTIGDASAAIAFTAPRPLQTMTGPTLHPIVTDGQGGVVVGRLGDEPLYVLADPDLLSNQGIADARQAAAALALLDYINRPGAAGIDFDVTLDGLGGSRSPLKLAFDPPFLTMTLAIAAALLLVGWQAFAQFGAPRRRAREIAFGKAALIDNAAALVRKAKRERALGGRYAYVVRERAGVAFGAPARLRDAALDAYLDRLGRRRKFTDLANAAAAVRDRQGVLEAARALHEWQWEKAT